MQEPPPPHLAGEADRNGVVALTGEGIESILADFRAWLTHLPEAPVGADDTENVDLASLIRHFTALRQEVHLQTRASRSQMEQSAQALEKLGEALQQLRQPANDPLDAVRPLLKSLIEVRDALALAQKQVSKTRSLPSQSPPPEFSVQLPGWARWLGLEQAVRGAVAPLQEWARARADAEQGQTILDSLVVGYTMSLQRLDRALEQHGLERIACVGLPFDPEIMEAVEVVKDESRSSSAVIEDVRPGYRYRGQLFRCAQVRVTRP
jgi:molecular chaperone GrpE